MQIKKYSGELVPFNGESLRHSLSRSGANADQVNQVYDKVLNEIYDGISTRELYQLAFDTLKTVRNSFAARYSLKKALRELGPEGFYFEKYIAHLLRSIGYESTTGQTVQGHAVSHELDVVAYKDGKLITAECKFRNDIDAKISVTTPMYYLSRFNDISNIKYQFFGKQLQFQEGWLITNAYFTSDSIDFAKYYNINLLSWDYPKENSIKKRVDKAVFYPVTCLTTLSDLEEQQLLKNQLILVKDIVSNPEKLDLLNLTKERKEKVLNEARELINYQVEEEY
ncbi:restriction endonuclease [Sphingobacterium multivorum]|uniref:Restriction endonuclease n=1 Tax=Sphingobacterium multivorum TaxID=28454 RepID=A0ABX7CX40_SPHMU|nr:ATP cone domain-containing protein [Sphingobacterium multivorum]QQT55960.1 restriction endonuclease [Sphingobacterium multivorum]